MEAGDDGGNDDKSRDFRQMYFGQFNRRRRWTRAYFLFADKFRFRRARISNSRENNERTDFNNYGVYLVTTTAPVKRSAHFSVLSDEKFVERSKRQRGQRWRVRAIEYFFYDEIIGLEEEMPDQCTARNAH